jgi:hypothetical protein
MVVVFHDAKVKAEDETMRRNFVEYGRRVELLINELDRRSGEFVV